MASAIKVKKMPLSTSKDELALEAFLNSLTGLESIIDICFEMGVVLIVYEEDTD